MSHEHDTEVHLLYRIDNNYFILKVNYITMGGRHVANFNQMYHHYRNFMKTGRPVYKPPYISAAVYDLLRNST